LATVATVTTMATTKTGRTTYHDSTLLITQIQRARYGWASYAYGILSSVPAHPLSDESGAMSRTRWAIGLQLVGCVSIMGT
jgi:hypothetical protein